MISSQLRAVGGSVMVAVPKPILETLGFTANMLISLSVEGENLVISRKKHRKHTLDSMLAECDLSLPMSEEDTLWLNAPAIGREFK
jgi:antitoxin ChpS